MTAFSTLSSEEKRCSVMEPLRRLRILTCTKPRRLPGVLWFMLKTEYNSLLNLITIPGRNCVADSMLESNSSFCENKPAGQKSIVASEHAKSPANATLVHGHYGPV